MLENGHIVGLSFLAPWSLGMTLDCEWKRHIYFLDWIFNYYGKTPSWLPCPFTQNCLSLSWELLFQPSLQGDSVEQNQLLIFDEYAVQ